MSNVEPIEYGFCLCGCGQKTPLADRNERLRGYVKGQPLRYIYGHNSRLKTESRSALQFKIEGKSCRLIPLTNGNYSIVDEEDFALVASYRWHAQFAEDTQTYYARATIYRNGKRTALSMARLILGLDFGDVRVADHKRPMDTLDNRRANLQISTGAENRRNTKLRAELSSLRNQVDHLQAELDELDKKLNEARLVLAVSVRAERLDAAMNQIAVLEAELVRMTMDNNWLLNDASVWRNRAISAETSLARLDEIDSRDTTERLKRARVEGRREGIEEAAKLCDKDAAEFEEDGVPAFGSISWYRRATARSLASEVRALLDSPAQAPEEKC